MKKIKLTLKIILLFSLTLGSFNGLSKDLILKNEQNVYQLGHYLEIFEDKTGKLTILDIVDQMVLQV